MQPINNSRDAEPIPEVSGQVAEAEGDERGSEQPVTLVYDGIGLRASVGLVYFG
jgi:hypothetical protein